MSKNTNVSLEMQWRWQDSRARHTDRQYFAKANLWRDIFPLQMGEPFTQAEAGNEARCSVPAGELLEPYTLDNIKIIKAGQFNQRRRSGLNVTPRLGRFYPRNFVMQHPDINSDDYRPMRIIGMEKESLRIDLNLPVSRFDVEITARIDAVLPPAMEHGGRCNDFVYDMLQSGVGMQADLAEGEIDYYSGKPFARIDETDDALFYTQPRLVQHLDATARQHIANLYNHQLKAGMRVLDLMSSWVSHLQKQDNIEVVGLGLNERELSQNAVLDHYVVHDLNRATTLPFADDYFDAVICTASVEYLVQPQAVFAEIARVLKPAGKALMTFSDRWFPPKAIGLWSELHPFERLGLVTDYFYRGGHFRDIETLSIRHYPRPADDKYSHELPYSDPVFAVSAIQQ